MAADRRKPLVRISRLLASAAFCRYTVKLPAVDRPSIRYDRSLNFYPYCSAKSAIFVKVDRTLASCNLNRMRGRKPQNIDY
jgi:hypothetical protein